MATKITTRVTENSAITEEKLASSSVTAAKLASSSVTEAKLASNSVTASKIAAGAVGASEIAAGAVGSSELASGSVTNAKVASGIDAAKLTGTLPALNGSNLTGVEPPTNRNAIGTYRLHAGTSNNSNTSPLGVAVGATITNTNGFTGTWRVMDIVVTGVQVNIFTQYTIVTLLVRVS